MRSVVLLVLVSVSSGCAPQTSAREPAPPQPERPVPPPQPPVMREPTPEGTTCGELTLEEVALVAGGKGERHPRLVAVRAARDKACARDDGGASLRAACLGVRKEYAEAQTHYGPKHPRMMELRAMLALCPEPAPQLPPTSDECDTLRARRAKAIAEGKGENHPVVQAIDAALKECP